MQLTELDAYRLSVESAQVAWNIYDRMHWQDKKIMGDQWISAIDSVGANIAEGFGRFHYLDKNKFNYNARGSLVEAIHWTERLFERGKIVESEKTLLLTKLESLHMVLNRYISSTRNLSLNQKR